MAFQIDHLFSVTTDRERARAALAQMGFELTARGEHPGRGTSNHLMFFGRCYWELLSVDQPGPSNMMLLGRGHVLVGCALRTEDVARDAAAARGLGAEADPPESLTRPVMLDGHWRTARFMTAALRTQAPIDAYLFFCQHLTPELVWPREPPKHPNGAFRLRALQVVGPSVEAAERGLHPLLGSGGGAEPQISYLSLDAYRARFALAPPLPSDERLRLASLELEVGDLDRCAAYLATQGITFRRYAREIQVYSEPIPHPLVFSASN
jgi:hypothetical protein